MRRHSLRDGFFSTEISTLCVDVKFKSLVATLHILNKTYKVRNNSVAINKSVSDKKTYKVRNLLFYLHIAMPSC
jgi:hypothetical protein